MSRSLERRVAELATTKTARKLGYKPWNQLVNHAVVAKSIDDLSDKDMAIIKKAEQELLATTANIYLDIDGVLIHGRRNKAALGANYFLRVLNKLMMRGINVYWLTTHCDGDVSGAVKYLDSYLSSSVSRAIITRIKPTSWTVKTQGINFSKPFLWFDDKPLGWADDAAMKEHGVTDSLVIVDLNKHPFALIGITLKLGRMIKMVTGKPHD